VSADISVERHGGAVRCGAPHRTALPRGRLTLARCDATPGRRLVVMRWADSLKIRTQAASQLRDLILTASEQVGQQLAGLPRERRVAVAARFRPQDLASPADDAKPAMASVTRRRRELIAEISRLDTALDKLVCHAARNSSWPSRARATRSPGGVGSPPAITRPNPHRGQPRPVGVWVAVIGDEVRAALSLRLSWDGPPCGQGINRSLPVVRRLSSSRWADRASASE
jgi:hypothetical protein